MDPAASHPAASHPDRRFHERKPYILYDARDSSVYWPPYEMTRAVAGMQNHWLALNGRPEIWVLRDALTLYLLANGTRAGRVN